MHHDPVSGRFALTPRDATTIDLEAKVFEALQPGNSHKAAEFWQEVLMDHIRNRHRKKRGLDPLISRWDRSAPETVISFVQEERAA